jgi:hypothetical protein
MQAKSNIAIDTELSKAEEQIQLSPYTMFKYSIRSSLPIRIYFFGRMHMKELSNVATDNNTMPSCSHQRL